MRGRRPSGTEVVDRQQGSSTAKERVKAVLDTIAGRCRVEEVCQRLDICEQRFRQLREEILAGALAAAEPGKPGRPPKILTPIEEQNHTLQEQLAAKDVELRAAQARAEIALTLPRVLQKPGVPTGSKSPESKLPESVLPESVSPESEIRASSTEKKPTHRPRPRGRPPRHPPRPSGERGPG